MNNHQIWPEKGNYISLKSVSLKNKFFCGGWGEKKASWESPYWEYSSWPGAYGCCLPCGWLRSSPSYVGNMRNISMNKHMLNNRQRAQTVLAVVPLQRRSILLLLSKKENVNLPLGNRELNEDTEEKIINATLSYSKPYSVVGGTKSRPLVFLVT